LTHIIGGGLDEFHMVAESGFGVPVKIVRPPAMFDGVLEREASQARKSAATPFARNSAADWVARQQLSDRGIDAECALTGMNALRRGKRPAPHGAL
jgi:hypothetical protein